MVLSPLFLCITMGFTDCQLFSATTVPATDTTPPATLDAVYLNGNYIAVSSTGGSFVYHIAPGASVLWLSSGIDDGGVSKITTSTSQTMECCRGSICERFESLSVPVVTTQDGSVGSTVSNGVWFGRAITAPALDCGNGFTLVSFHFSWATVAEDFHSNHASGASQSIAYP
jgi:hypothetical protein